MKNLAIEYRSLSELIPYARNSRTHSDEQIAQIAASIREFGFTNPVLIDENEGIIAGHGRVLAASRLKKDIVPCIKLSHLTPAQKQAYVIADNRIALNAAWDKEILSNELRDLEESNFDLDLLGFQADELVKLMYPDGEPESNKDIDSVDLGPQEFLLVIECDNEIEQQNIYQEISARGLKCKIM